MESTPSAPMGPTQHMLWGLLNLVDSVLPEPHYDREAELARDLSKLARLFDIEQLDDEWMPKGRTVEEYYTATEAQYSAWHSPAGAVHFGLDPGGRAHPDGLYGQARLVERLVRAHDVRAVLETGSGKGFNCIFLAARNPGTRFVGIDRTPLHLQISRDRGRALSNLRFEEGDFCALPMADASFDLVFSVEASCYADTPEKLERMLAEVRRVLKPGGRFTLIDFYRPPDFAQHSRLQQRAVELLEGAWVIERFQSLDAFEAAASRAGLRVEVRDDLRTLVMPSVRRLHRLSRLSLKLEPLLKPFLGPHSHTSFNALAAMTLPYAFALGALEYRHHVLVAPVEG